MVNGATSKSNLQQHIALRQTQTAVWSTEVLPERERFPYWRDAAHFAGEHGVKVALEAHPGFIVYNVDSALRLREAVGPNLGVNFDPSHLF